MTFWTLIHRSLRYHARAHVGVLLGAAVGSAALIGALVVGDCVRGTLREAALERLGKTRFALNSNDLLFKDDLAARLQRTLSSSRTNKVSGGEFDFATVLVEPASAARQDGQARANRVKIYGFDSLFAAFAGASGLYSNWGADEVMVNETLARQLQLRAGDTVIFRAPKSSTLSRDAVVSPKSDQAVAIRLTVRGVTPASALGNLNLTASQAAPLNAFVRIEILQKFLSATNQANLLLVGEGKQGKGSETAARERQSDLDVLRQALRDCWELSDMQLDILPLPLSQTLELRSRRVFLDNTIQKAILSEAAPTSPLPLPQSAGSSSNLLLNSPAQFERSTKAQPLLTYLVSLVGLGASATPYSMVTAAGPPFTPDDLREDEIVFNQWLAEDLGAKPGDRVSLVYFDPESGAHLSEKTNYFRVHSIVPMNLPWSDRSLLPDFPGIEKAESTHEWDAGFPLVYKIRPKDEEYWKKYRGTPKAFVSLAAGQSMWTNRFGSLTAIRFAVPREEPVARSDNPYRAALETRLRSNLRPEDGGLVFQELRSRALLAADQAQDFGQLFLGFSIFVVTAALLLMSVLFQFGLEQRATEVGTLLALGFTPRRLRWLLLVEAAALAFAGAILGLGGGIIYAKAMLWGLGTIWRDAVGQTQIGFHVSSATLLAGVLTGVVVALFTIWLTLRKQARQPAYQLLTGETESRATKSRRFHVARWLFAGCSLGAVGILGWSFSTPDRMNVEAFFGAGTLLLIGGLAFMALWLARLARQSSRALTLSGLGVRTCARRSNRSLATVSLLASGCFLIVSIGAFRLDANRESSLRSSGTGGFALTGESTLPIVQDLNSGSGRESLGIGSKELAEVNVVPFRARDGDEASCLNLNRAQQPRLLGVNPTLLRGRFTFSAFADPNQSGGGWEILRRPASDAGELDEVRAIGDANSIQWALGKKVGDVIEYTDDKGRKFKLRLVGALANSILQGSLIIDEAEFIRLFPSESGYRNFLIDAPANATIHVSGILTRALQDFGLELAPTARRLNEFNAVQNTYLGTFQILGGLGLLLGSAGLGVVVLRNVLERRGELGLLVAVGYRRRTLRQMLLVEHGVLLVLGLGMGVVAGLIAVLPALMSPGRQLPYLSLGGTLIAVIINGALWTWVATRFALRGNLLAALRNE